LKGVTIALPTAFALPSSNIYWDVVKKIFKKNYIVQKIDTGVFVIMAKLPVYDVADIFLIATNRRLDGGQYRHLMGQAAVGLDIYLTSGQI
jgi:hypothetical protein